MNINLREAVRYLGYKGSVPDPHTMEIVRSVADEVAMSAAPKSVYRRFKAEVREEEVVAADIVLRSRNLAHNLMGCREIVIMAATLGSEIDMLMNRYQKLDITRAAVLQAVAAAAIEDYCNEINIKIRDKVREEGLYLRPRYSPGDGDLSLDYQKDILGLLQADKFAGITLTEGGIMLPEKSVSAIIGVTDLEGSRHRGNCVLEGCDACMNNDTCEFRR